MKSVIIVKVKWSESETNGKVQAVFYNEDSAHDYIDERKGLDKYKDAIWILSDRPILDS